MSQAERAARIRDAVARARTTVARLRMLLAALEALLAALERMQLDAIPNVAALRRAVDAAASARREADEALLGTVEAADRVQDALGACTRLVLRGR